MCAFNTVLISTVFVILTTKPPLTLSCQPQPFNNLQKIISGLITGRDLSFNQIGEEKQIVQELKLEQDQTQTIKQEEEEEEEIDWNAVGVQMSLPEENEQIKLDLSRDLNWKEEVDKEFQTQTNTTIKEREKQEQEINCGNDVRFQTEEILQTSEKTKLDLLRDFNGKEKKKELAEALDSETNTGKEKEKVLMLIPVYRYGKSISGQFLSYFYRRVERLRNKIR